MGTLLSFSAADFVSAYETEGLARISEAFARIGNCGTRYACPLTALACSKGASFAQIEQASEEARPGLVAAALGILPAEVNPFTRGFDEEPFNSDIARQDELGSDKFTELFAYGALVRTVLGDVPSEVE